jgi:hypothetical protein
MVLQGLLHVVRKSSYALWRGSLKQYIDHRFERRPERKEKCI